MKINKESIKFAEWIAENHFRLNNIQDGKYLWKNEYEFQETNSLYIKFKTENMKIKDTMSEWIETQVKDSVVQSVINKFKQRSEVGIKKYNTTLDREDLTDKEWINHAQEEAMDLILYLEKLKRL
jgi:dTDP-glucose pyrophosphorylase